MASQPALHDVSISAVALYRTRPMPKHEVALHSAVSRQLAALHGVPFIGTFDPAVDTGGRIYVVPSGTLIEGEMAKELDISHLSHFFGGRVPYPFVATKAITHPLIGPQALAPEGWSDAFFQRIGHATLPGWTAFSVDDAHEACVRLLALGPVRVKPVHASGGRGQSVVTSAHALPDALAAIEPDALALCGVVLESHLEEVTTFSVGQVTICDLTATYVGTQCLTTDNAGGSVYGGSRLMVVRGGFDALLALDLEADARAAIAHANCYDEAASACFPRFIASRRNYDTISGIDAAGRRCGGVLEQSWRIGGASGAELAAVTAFRQDPDLRRVQARSIERYGRSHEPPPGASVAYRGVDDECGPMIKYVIAENL